MGGGGDPGRAGSGWEGGGERESRGRQTKSGAGSVRAGRPRWEPGTCCSPASRTAQARRWRLQPPPSLAPPSCSGPGFTSLPAPSPSAAPGVGLKSGGCSCLRLRASPAASPCPFVPPPCGGSLPSAVGQWGVHVDAEPPPPALWGLSRPRPPEGPGRLLLSPPPRSRSASPCPGGTHARPRATRLPGSHCTARGQHGQGWGAQPGWGVRLGGLPAPPQHHAKEQERSWRRLSSA